MNNDNPSSDFITEVPAEDASYTEIRCMYTSRSGFSELWELRRLGKLHVLKSLQSVYRENPLYENLLRKEFDIGYKLEHAHICRTLGWERHETLGNCILMEYVDGETLSDFMLSGKLTNAMAYKFINEICDGLQYVHNKQIIHRDLKPGNILITHNGNNVKLIDFGLSDCDDYHTLKIPAGTRNYIAPEQMQEGVTLDARADVYSLGVIVGEFAELLDNRYLKMIAAKATQSNRDKRYASVAELRQVLNRRRLSRGIGVALLVGLLAAGVLFLFPHKESASPGVGRHVAASEVVYDSSPMNSLYQQTLQTEVARLRGTIKQPDINEEQLKEDSVQLVGKLKRVVDLNFPLEQQKQSELYKQQLNELHQTVAREMAKLRSAIKK